MTLKTPESPLPDVPLTAEAIRLRLPAGLRRASIYRIGTQDEVARGIVPIPPVEPDAVDQHAIDRWRRENPDAPAYRDKTIRRIMAQRLSLLGAVEAVLEAGIYPAIVLQGSLRLSAVAQVPPLPERWRIAMLYGVPREPVRGPGWKRVERVGWRGSRAIALHTASGAMALRQALMAQPGSIDAIWQEADPPQGAIGVVPSLFDAGEPASRPSTQERHLAVWSISSRERPDAREWIEAQLADWQGPVFRIELIPPEQVPIASIRKGGFRNDPEMRGSGTLRAEIGRIRSHRYATQAIVSGGHYPALVIEEGALLPEPRDLLPGPQAWQLILLGESVESARGEVHGVWQRTRESFRYAVNGYAIGDAFVGHSLDDLFRSEQGSFRRLLRRIDQWALMYAPAKRPESLASGDVPAGDQIGASVTAPDAGTVRTATIALDVRGDFLQTTGYAHHSWEFLRGLHRIGVPLSVKFGDLETGETSGRDRTFLEALSCGEDANVSLQFCMPTAVEFIPGKRIVNHTMFETSVAPAHWATIGNQCDLVVVPAHFLEEAWQEAGVAAEKIAVAPLGIDHHLFGADVDPLPIITEGGVPVSAYRFRFLNVSEIGSRKNLVGLVQAWLMATRADDNAILILKLADYYKAFEGLSRQIAQMTVREGLSLRDAAPIHFVFDFFRDSEMPSLYQAATHYLNLSHGEGWDNCTMEAVASGLTPIVPNHSAYPTYLDADCAHFIPSPEAPAVWPGTGPMPRLFRGLNWWNPSVEAAAEIIRGVIDERAPVKTNSRQRILRDFTWDRASDRLWEVLQTRVGLG